MRTDELTEAEMVEILEDLARNSGSATARIQAIKTLREMRGAAPPVQTEGFAALYEVGKPPKSKAA